MRGFYSVLMLFIFIIFYKVDIYEAVETSVWVGGRDCLGYLCVKIKKEFINIQISCGCQQGS